MRNLQRFFAAPIILVLLVTFTLLAATPVFSAQQSTSALERGYRTGYSDGYQAGFRDSNDRADLNYRNKEEYQRADRAYVDTYGTLEDYRDGYQQGFEVGYASGYDRRSFDSTVPTPISRRGVVDVSAQVDDDQQASSSSSGSVSGRRTSGSGGVTTTGSGRSSSGGTVTIPPNTVMLIELLTNLSTDASQKGDHFEARVIEPREYDGAMLRGVVSRVKRSGRVRGSSEIQLAFEQISLNGRWSNFEAQVVEVVAQNGTGVGDVDDEGGVRGTGSTRGDVTKIGAATAIGAIIGAIAGGGKGAAIGAAIGAGMGTGGAISSRGSDIRLPAGQQLKIRTSKYTRF